MAEAEYDLDVAQARALVEKIADDHGFVSEDDLATMTPEVRERVRRAMFNKDQKTGALIVALAKTLYESDVKFVLELIQNADNNAYTQAIAAGQKPYIHFQVHPSQIIIDTNEDGFTQEDVTALCNVGKSTRPGPRLYTGSKGVGFKSVFMAAWKVHIQSRNFSFTFQHREGDSGMGMISPAWHEPEEQLEKPMTRVTLSLIKPVDTSQPGLTEDFVMQQFSDVEATLLLFMKKLEKITTSFFDNNGDLLWMKEHVRSTIVPERIFFVSDNGNRVSIKWRRRSTVEPETVGLTTATGIKQEVTQTTKSEYLLVQHTVTNIPKDDSGAHLGDTVRPKEQSESNIILAFPLTMDLFPIIESQYVFTPLPLSKYNRFKFIIQADFVTDISQQYIITTSPRNLALAGQIGPAFVKAVHAFCDQDVNLKYQWMRYLPQRADGPWDDFCMAVLSGIETHLSSACVMFSMSLFSNMDNQDRRQISQFHPSRKDAVDEFGAPLIRFPIYEPIFSKAYLQSDLELLEAYGLKYRTMNNEIERLADRLSLHKSNPWSPMTNKWNVMVARLLRSYIEEDAGVQARLKSLALIPLKPTKLRVSSTGKLPIYYPKVNDIQIPDGLPIDLVDEVAASYPELRTLFSLLGAEEASVPTIRQLIFDEARRLENMNVETSRDHLHFLYLTHEPDGNDHARYHDIWVVAYDWPRLNPHIDDVYLPTRDLYGPRRVLRPLDRTANNTEAGANGFHVPFINAQYLLFDPPKAEKHSLSWNDWLLQQIGIRRYLRVIKNGVLTEAFTYIVEHRPSMALGTLQSSWASEGDMIRKNKDVLERLKDIHVPTEDGGNVRLKEAYLPLENLKRECERLLVEHETFPFLKMPVSLHQVTLPEWSFLYEDLGAITKDDIRFYLKILISIRHGCTGSNPHQLERAERVLDLYQIIHGALSTLDQDKQESEMAYIRKVFIVEELVLLPHKQPNYSWARPTNCRWDAPTNMHTLHSLGSLYSSAAPPTGGTNFMIHRQFFMDVVGVLNCTWTDIIGELKKLKAIGSPEPRHIQEILTFLDTLMTKAHESHKVIVKSSFERDALICVVLSDGPQWFKTSQCLWSGPLQTCSLTTLKEHYSNLKSFFVNTLGVKTPTLDMIYLELLSKTRPSYTSVEETKDLLWQFSTLLATSTPAAMPPLEELRDHCIFPVRSPDGQTILVSDKTTFWICDRKYLGDAFRDELKLLDFDLFDIQQLGPLIRWAKLESRLLSKAVKETTSVDKTSLAPISNPRRDLKPKAHALYRIAHHFQSLRILEDSRLLYDHLLRTTVFETDQISSRLHLSLATKEISGAVVHFETSESGLDVYVPRNAELQDACYLSKLPHMISEWLMVPPSCDREWIPDPTIISLVKSVLNATESALDTILNLEGIADVEIPALLLEMNNGSQDLRLEADNTQNIQRQICEGSETALETSLEQDDSRDDLETSSLEVDEQSTSCETPTSSSPPENKPQSSQLTLTLNIPPQSIDKE